MSVSLQVLFLIWYQSLLLHSASSHNIRSVIHSLKLPLQNEFIASKHLDFCCSSCSLSKQLNIPSRPSFSHWYWMSKNSPCKFFNSVLCRCLNRGTPKHHIHTLWQWQCHLSGWCQLGPRVSAACLGLRQHYSLRTSMFKVRHQSQAIIRLAQCDHHL